VEARNQSAPRRIGVYGGTFDPLHQAHLTMARAAREQAELDLVLFVVSARPPHKAEGSWAPAEDRYDMVRAALAREEGLQPCRLELDREGPSYTADTLEQIQEHYPEAELFLVIGMDSLVDLPKWREPERILERAHLLAIPRPGQWAVPKSLEDRYTLIQMPQTDLSSTEIRERFEKGESLDSLIPAPVIEMIYKRGLYDAVRRGRPR
jgi:nicotinate-nucleotide adenylyltransferase